MITLIYIQWETTGHYSKYTNSYDSHPLNFVLMGEMVVRGQDPDFSGARALWFQDAVTAQCCDKLGYL